jgi:S-adenosylmethionine/arginine decarboxylase-like enzyme
MSGFWGYHLILDCNECDKEAVTNPKTIRKFSKDLVKSINMVAYGNPIIKHFGENDEKLSGYTLIQLIETSNITAHFCDLTGDAYIDIFSCKEFDIDVAIEMVKKYFSPTNIYESFLFREANRKIM